jgi:DNA-binding FrmR family transcriptional regulator
MPPSKTEIVAARLARMKGLIDSLEEACSESDEQREMFRQLRQELAAARAALEIVPSPSE